MENKTETNKSVFCTLNGINVNDHTEKKNGLTYLSWAWAWAEVKKLYPDTNYKIYETPDGCFYFTDGRTCWVKTGVTINGLEHIEYLPVMDFRNASIPVDKVTSFDVNKAIQRSLTKAVARHGLGLYIYAGEDLPEDGETPANSAMKPAKASTPQPKATTAQNGGKTLVTMAMFEAGKCKNLIKHLAGYDYNNFPEWEAGVHMLEAKYDFALGVMESIETAARAERTKAGK